MSVSLKRRFKNWLKRAWIPLHKFARRWLKVYILPVHYYVPLADIAELHKTRDHWAKPSEMPGIDMDLDQQIENMRSICGPWVGEVAGNRIYHEGVKGGFGPGYGYIEAQAIHGFVRHFKPRRFVEVGCGVSTYCMLEAAKMNQADGGHDFEYTCIEPYPSDWLRASRQIKLVHAKVQQAPLEVFTQLEANDLVFLDSSHAVRTDGDVNRMVLEVFPRLKPGVIVHIHDMNFPYDYPRWIAQNLMRGAENSLVWAWLIHNPRVRVLLSCSFLHYQKPEAIKDVFPEYDRDPDRDGLADDYSPFLAYHLQKHFPSSLYLRIQ